MRKAISCNGIAAFLLLAHTAAAATADLVCEAGKLKVSSVYSGCVLKAHTSSVLKGTTLDVTKCDSIFNTKFPAYEANAGVGVCPSNGDTGSVKTFLDACIGRVASALGGAALPMDVTLCNADLATTNADLGACQSNCVGSVKAALRTGDVYAAGSGSDGVLREGSVRSFTDNGDGTITDNTTRLMWEKKDMSGTIHDVSNTYTWSTGTGTMNGTLVTVFLAGLNGGGGFAGHTDWRIPNRFELDSLNDLGGYDPALYPEFYSGCTAGCTVINCSCVDRVTLYTWTSTGYANAGAFAWEVDQTAGAAGLGTTTASELARAVRSLP